MSVTWSSTPVTEIRGSIRVPGDKSISHRAVIMAALANGVSEVRGFLAGADCLATIHAFRAMGITITEHGKDRLLRIHGRGLHGLQAPGHPLDLGNSGTSMRLMAGVLAGQSFPSELIGDASLMQRPMRRVTEPLARMGAQITTSPAGTAPLLIHGRPLDAIDYRMPVASAQLKSCLLFAGLYGNGVTRVRECGVSRDHSERMLKRFGVLLSRADNMLGIAGGQTLSACAIAVPGDISSAVFFIVAGLLAEKGELLIEGVGFNPTRAAAVEILQQMGGSISVMNTRETDGEPVADLLVKPSRLHGIRVPETLVPIAIDEFPIIFVAAACAQGETHATALRELRVKESDRLAAMENGLRALGVDCKAGKDTMTIRGGSVRGGTVDSCGDHRIAMSFAVAAVRAAAPVRILDCANVATSFPNFRELAEAVGMQIESHNA